MIDSSSRAPHRRASTPISNGSEEATAGTAYRSRGECVRSSVVSSGSTGSSAPHRRSSKAPLLTGGSSFDVTPACSCCAPSAGFPEKHGSAIDALKTSSSKSAHSARRESPGSSTGRCSNRCIDVSSRRLPDTELRAPHNEESRLLRTDRRTESGLNREDVRARSTDLERFQLAAWRSGCLAVLPVQRACLSISHGTYFTAP